MSEVMEKMKTSRQAKTACWLFALLTVAVALAGYIISAFDHRTEGAAVLITISAFLTIGLCAMLLHRYDKRSDPSGAILYRRILHGLMLHALFVATAALVYATSDSQNVTVSLVVAIALADAALAATMVFLLAGACKNWTGEARIWAWIALLLGVAVFALRFFGIDGMVWIAIAVPAAAAIIFSACKLRMHNNLYNLIFAFAVTIFAVVLLIGGYAPITQLILHVLCLILSPVYALATFLTGAPVPASVTNASESRCMRNGGTVIYGHTAVNPADTSKSDMHAEDDADIAALAAPDADRMQEREGLGATDYLQTEDDRELDAIREKIRAWRANIGSTSDALALGSETMQSTSKDACVADAGASVHSQRQTSELNCDIALVQAYRLLSLKYLSIAPIEAFAGISEAQVACMETLGVHTIADLAALPICRIAEQIVLMASREENGTVGN